MLGAEMAIADMDVAAGCGEADRAGCGEMNPAGTAMMGTEPTEKAGMPGEEMAIADMDVAAGCVAEAQTERAGGLAG